MNTNYEEAYKDLKRKYELQKEVLEEFSKFVDHKLWVHKGSYVYGYYRQRLNDVGIMEDK